MLLIASLKSGVCKDDIFPCVSRVDFVGGKGEGGQDGVISLQAHIRVFLLVQHTSIGRYNMSPTGARFFSINFSPVSPTLLPAWYMPAFSWMPNLQAFKTA